LAQAFRLALEQERLSYAPTIKRIPVPENARSGTFTAEEFLRLEAVLPEYLRDFARWAYFTGWRAGGIRSLRWEDIHDNVLTVRAQYSKTRKAQDIPLTADLLEIIQRRATDQKGPYVFHYKNGDPIGCYKTAWATALKKTGLKGRLFHDFRRTCATNLSRAGVPEQSA
jgi:integrase